MLSHKNYLISTYYGKYSVQLKAGNKQDYYYVFNYYATVTGAKQAINHNITKYGK
jgi:hypothetical protein